MTVIHNTFEGILTYFLPRIADRFSHGGSMTIKLYFVEAKQWG